VQAAAHCLTQAAEPGGPVSFASIGVMQALNRHVECVFDPSRKDKHIGDAGSWREISKFVVYSSIVAKARSPRNVND
jgi:hypothetical protein